MLSDFASKSLSPVQYGWIKAYLTNRLQCVSINSCVSSPLPVISGVPQGSILGPLLFLIFINDLPTSLSSSDLLLFADDAKCAHHISCLSDCLSLQFDLDHLTLWSKAWNLHFNKEKCVILRISRKQSPTLFNYHISGDPLVTVSTHKDLGILLSSNLSWSSHYDLLLKRAYRILNLIRRTFYNVNCVQTKKVLYLSLVRSHFQYCSPLWHPHFIRDITSIETLQRRATKYILCDFSSDYKSRLIRLKILPLMMTFELQDVLFFIKSFKEPSTSFDIRNFLPHVQDRLPSIDLDQPLLSIKKSLRTYFWNAFTSKFNVDSPCTYHLVCPCSKCALLPVPHNFHSTM